MLAVRPCALTARAVGLPFSSLALHLAFTFPPGLAFARAAPWCEGQNLEGADLAPDAMRDAGLSDAVKSLGLSFTDRGDVDFTSVAPSTNHYSIGLYREWLSSNPTANFATWMRKRETNKKKKSGESTMARKRSYETALHEQSLINVVNAELIGDGLRLVHDAVHAAVLREGPQKPFVLTVGGDHSIASASISALQAQHPNLGVIWVDAHADANTPRSSPSGHYHGMPAAHLLGWFEKPGEMGEGSKAVSLPGFDWFPSGCLSESRLAYIGLRDVDPEEARLLRRSGVRIFTMRDVDKHGIAKVIEMAIEAVGPSMDNPLHLSLDVDAIDPHYAPGTGTAARGGLTYREIHYICEECALTKRLVSMDVVEVNPGLDPPPEKSANPLEEAGAMHGDHPSIRRASPTVRLAVELVLSALGKQIC